jgi:hypothetical protein
MRIELIHTHTVRHTSWVINCCVKSNFLEIFFRKKRPYSNPGLVRGFTGLKPAAQEGE